MPYVAPATPSPGDVLTAAFWNTHVRDRILQSPEALASAAGQALYSTGTNAITMVHGAKYQVADHTIISQTTLQNAPNLAWAVAANEVWGFKAFLQWTMASGGPLSLVVAFTVPAGSAGWYTAVNNQLDIGGGPGAATRADYAIAATPTSGHAGIASVAGRLYVYDGVFFNGNNPGTVQFQWAQGVSTAINTSLKAGSYIDLKRLA